MNGDELRIRAKLKEDFAGDKAAWHRKMEDTTNMFDLLTDVNGRLVLNLMDVMKLLEEKVEIEKRPGNNSSHTTQNN